jgi:hypothetical protein
MPALHPDVSLCHGPCDRICPNTALSRCAWCAKEMCDECVRTNPFDLEEQLCPCCAQEAIDSVRAHKLAPKVESIATAAHLRGKWEKA